MSTDISTQHPFFIYSQQQAAARAASAPEPSAPTRGADTGNSRGPVDTFVPSSNGNAAATVSGGSSGNSLVDSTVERFRRNGILGANPLDSVTNDMRLSDGTLAVHVPGAGMRDNPTGGPLSVWNTGGSTGLDSVSGRMSVTGSVWVQTGSRPEEGHFQADSPVGTLTYNRASSTLRNLNGQVINQTAALDANGNRVTNDGRVFSATMNSQDTISEESARLLAQRMGGSVQAQEYGIGTAYTINVSGRQVDAGQLGRYLTDPQLDGRGRAQLIADRFGLDANSVMTQFNLSGVTATLPPSANVEGRATSEWVDPRDIAAAQANSTLQPVAQPVQQAGWQASSSGQPESQGWYGQFSNWFKSLFSWI